MVRRVCRRVVAPSVVHAKPVGWQRSQGKRSAPRMRFPCRHPRQLLWFVALHVDTRSKSLRPHFPPASIAGEADRPDVEMSLLRNAVWIGAAWLCLATVLAFGLGSINIARLLDIARNPVSTDAVIVLTDCANHAAVFYSYDVSDRTYTGRANLGSHCESLRKGDTIRVYLSAHAPELSEASDPKAALIGELTVIG